MMETLKNKVKEWREKKMLPKLLLLLILLLLGMTGIGVAYAHNNVNSRLERQLALGDQYMEDMDYERAIAAYEEALRIDDKCVAAYVGISEAYVQLGDLDMAIRYLELGVEKTGSEELSAKLEEVRALKEQLETEREETTEEPKEEEPDDRQAEVITEEPEEEEPEEETPVRRPVRKEPEAAAVPEPTEVVEAVVEPLPYIPQPEPAPVPQPDTDSGKIEFPGLPRGLNMKPITLKTWIIYDTTDIGGTNEGLPGAVIKAELCEKYDEAAEAILIGSTENGILELSSTGDADYQDLRITIQLPEGYYFWPSDERDLCNYDANWNMYSGRVMTYSNSAYTVTDSYEGGLSVWEGGGGYLVVHPTADGILTAATPASLTVHVGDTVDESMISLTHVSPDGVTESVTGLILLHEPGYFTSTETAGSGLCAVKTGSTYIGISYKRCWIKVPVLITGSDPAWVDDIYANLINNNYQAVISAVNEADFLSKCEEYVYQGWGGYYGESGYRLLTSDGRIVGVVNHSGETCVFYCDKSYQDYGFESLGYGDRFVEVITDGSGTSVWCDGAVVHGLDGTESSLNENDVYILWHT